MAPRWQRTFAVLRVRDYRLFASSLFLSLVGTVVQTIGQAWLVLRLHGGGVALGTVTAAQFLALFAIGPLGGVVADRRDKRQLLLVTQVGMASLAALMAVLTATGWIRLWSLVALVFVYGCFGAVDAPARSALIPELVGEDGISNAVSLNEVWINSARITGPVLGGLLVAWFGPQACFAVNALSFLPMTAVLRWMRPMPVGPRAERHRADLVDGLRYAWNHAGARSLLVLAAAIGAFFNFGVVLPLLAHDTFGGGPTSLGLMIAAIGAGAVIGSLVLASAGEPTPERLLRLGGGACVSLLLAAVAPTLAWDLAFLALSGAAGVTLVAVANALLQLRCDAEFRGRLLALWTVAIVGSAVISGPIVGGIASVGGPRSAIAAIAVGVAAATFVPRATFRGQLAAREESTCNH